MRSLSVGLAILAAVQLGQHFVEAHSWIDCFDTNYTKIYEESASYIYGGEGGNGFCDGYGAGYPGRGDIDIGTEYTFKMLENEVEAGTAVCETVDADTYTNTNWRKRISVAPGVKVYFAYLPNGHIVKDKKAIGTQHGIYWTGGVGTTLTSTLEITEENLMDGYKLNFDDGNCGESYDYNGNPGGRAGDGKPCIGTFTVPTGTAAGIYSMVWYWTFWLDNEALYVDQLQARGYFGAAYSTCFEVEVTTGSGSTTIATQTPRTDAPLSATSAPLVTTAAPAAATSIPVATTETPETPAPTATTSAPITSWDQVDASSAAGDADSDPVTSVPASTTAAPVVSTPVPIVTRAAPTTLPALEAATEAPKSATSTPASVIQPSVSATSAPEAATDAPVPTNAAPTVTQTPVSTPEAVTEAPIATTATPSSVPVIQTPVSTASAPETATEVPASTASAPSTITQTPISSTTTTEPVTEASATDSPVQTSAVPETPSETPDSTDESDGGYSSFDSATFASLDYDEGSVGTVHAASTSFSTSSSKSSTSDDSLSSDSSAAEVGSGSFGIEPEVTFDSASASESGDDSSKTMSSSASTASASANAESNTSTKVQPGLILSVALIIASVWF